MNGKTKLVDKSAFGIGQMEGRVGKVEIQKFGSTIEAVHSSDCAPFRFICMIIWDTCRMCQERGMELDEARPDNLKKRRRRRSQELVPGMMERMHVAPGRMF